MAASTNNLDDKRHGAQSRLDHGSYTVGWVCALPKEQTAAVAMLEKLHVDLPSPPSDTNAYFLGSIKDHNIVIACLPKGKYGTNSAATVATRMIATFPNIKIGLMVGIGGGVPPKVQLGDVVVSCPIDQYPGVVQWDMGKAEDGGNFRRTGTLNSPPSLLLAAVGKLESRYSIFGSKIPETLQGVATRLPSLAEQFTKPPTPELPSLPESSAPESYSMWWAFLIYLTNVVRFLLGYSLLASKTVSSQATRISSAKPTKHPQVHHGLVASGNQVIKDAVFRDKLNSTLGGQVLCVEMEAAGLMNDFPCLVIRGICDYADAGKNKEWQEYSAAVAAAYARELLYCVETVSIQAAPRIQDVLGSIHESIRRTENTMSSMSTRLENKRDVEILEWLTDASYGPQQSDFVRRRQPGTGNWLLESTHYAAFMSAHSKVLFCPGIPGAGKTIMTSIVVDDISKRIVNDENVGLGYMYLNYKQQDSQKIEDLISSLLRQLCSARKAVPEAVMQMYSRHERTSTRPSRHELLKAIHLVVAIFTKVYIVVDALDECKQADGTRSTLIKELLRLQSEKGVSIFATSRHIPDVEEAYGRDLVLEIRATPEDVQRYLATHLQHLPAFVHRNPELTQEIITDIATAVDGMFLLAQLYLYSLSDKMSPKAIRATLAKLRRQATKMSDNDKAEVLAAAYGEAMSRINGQQKGFQSLATRILSWITAARRPLTIAELEYALGVEKNTNELDRDNVPAYEDIITVCAGLVAVDEDSNIIRLVHYTLQEYFDHGQTKWFPGAQMMISDSCLTVLMFDAFGSGPCEKTKDLDSRLAQHALYDYAGNHWPHHVRNLVPMHEDLLRFLESPAHLEAACQVFLAKAQESVNFNPGRRADYPGQTNALHMTARFNLDNATRVLLATQMGIDQRDGFGRVPLYYAAMYGSLDVATTLLDAGANPDIVDLAGRSSTATAADYYQADALGLLLQRHADPNLSDQYGETALSIAAQYGKVNMVDMLLKAGAHFDIADNEGETVLSKAAEDGYIEIVNMLIERGARIETRTEDGKTPLHFAAEGGHAAVVEVLIQRGASVSRRDDRGWSALSYAANGGHADTVRLLIGNAAEVNPRDRNGATPLHLAAGSGYQQPDKYLETVRLLLATGKADVDAFNRHDQTSLSLASQVSGNEAGKVLIEAGADPAWVDKFAMTPIHYASKQNNVGLMSRLLAIDSVDMHKKTKLGEWPLTLAAAGGHVEIVRLLLRKSGIDVTLQNGFARETALHVAVKNRRTHVVELLLRDGRIPLDVENYNGDTARAIAIHDGLPQIMQLFGDALPEGEKIAVEERWRTVSGAGKRGDSSTEEMEEELRTFGMMEAGPEYVRITGPGAYT
ncbi:hypothetical protein CAC42_7517 [Sphaceloma murrayae]|uniref:Uncharacterized protein n=1 Tax=Sphaceloma murrayae TaxID=2082308 RepID=A0A2K1QXN2_9PEZI|nr:hypothetical protein CAC42_7517 [Sphaceloma murrayae]